MFVFLPRELLVELSVEIVPIFCTLDTTILLSTSAMKPGPRMSYGLVYSGYAVQN